MRNLAGAVSRVLVVVLLLQTSLAGRAQELSGPAPASQFTSGRNSARVPFELVGNFVFLRASVNESGPLWFLLDTGATASYLDVERAKSLGLGRGNEVEGATLNLRGLKVPGQNFRLQPLRFGTYSGHAIDGLLGYDFTSRFVVEIDYVNKTLTLSAPEAFKYSGPGEVLPLTLLEDDLGGKVPLVRVRITERGRAPVEGNFIADTAVRSSVSFNTPFVEANGLLQSARRTIQAPLGGGAMVRESKQPVGRVENVGLGRFTFKNLVAVFFQTKQGVVASPEFDGVDGAEVLRRFKVVFDYTRRQLILEPNGHFREPEEYDMSGALLVAEGADFKTFKVKQLVEDSPASAAGLREGDVISAVGGTPASGLTLERLRKMFRLGGRKYRLRVERAGRKIETVIKLKRLV